MTVAQRIRDVDAPRDFTYTLYKGNAFLIALYEYKDEDGTDMYQMSWFLLDKDHAKRCLGLEKDTSNMFSEAENFIPKNMTLYRENCPHWKDVISLFTKACPDMPIMLLAKDPKGVESND